MSTDEPEVMTVISKGQIMIPSRLRKEFQQRVEDRAGAVGFSMNDIDGLVHDARNGTE